MNRTALLFPGQGAQSVGMGRQIAESLPQARKLYAEASEIVGYDLARVCFEGPAEQLDTTACSQPALFVTSLAALESLRSTDPRAVDGCDATAGLSLGEYTALVAAGAIDFPAGLKLVELRGRAMQMAADQLPGAMASVLGLDAAVLERLCGEARRAGETLEIANYLCPQNYVVSGDRDPLMRLARLAERAGAMKVVPLSVAGAFHTKRMEPALAELRAAIDQTPIAVPRVPVVSNVDALPHSDPDDIRRLLVRQVVEPVRWEASMEHLLQAGFNRFYEIGPGRVLRGLLRRIQRSASCQSIAA